MKVYQLSEFEWYFAETLEEAYAATGLTREEYERDFKARELTEEEMDKPGEVDIAAEGEPRHFVSFREALKLATCDGEKSGILCRWED